MSLSRDSLVTIDRHGVASRRDFLRNLAVAGGAAGLVAWPEVLRLHADDLKKQGMSCILLWMAGGPSQFETFDPKPGHDNGGATKAIDTSVAGIQLAENLPQLAKQMNDLCLIRSMTGKEGSHPRASFLMQTGYLPTAAIKYPAIGASVAKEIGDPEHDLPGFVRIGRSQAGAGGGFLGVNYDPFVVNGAGGPPENATLASSSARFDKRLALLGQVEGGFAARGGEKEVEDHRQLYQQAAKMITSPKMEAFDLGKESSKTKTAYGSGSFASGCLLARRLVEAGVTFVEVTLNGWDTHRDNFTASKRLCEQFDQPMAQLIRDLKERGRLEKTLVLWMGEFGRTPRINPNQGRDHFPRAYSVVMAGGGVKGGQVIGETSKGGDEVKNRPVSVVDLMQTIYHGLKIDANKERHTSIGRPIKVVDGGKPVKEVFGG